MIKFVSSSHHCWLQVASSPSKRCQESRLLPFHNTGIPKHGPYDNVRRKMCGHTHSIFSQQVSKWIHYFCLQPINQNPVTWPNHLTSQGRLTRPLLCSERKEDWISTQAFSVTVRKQQVCNTLTFQIVIPTLETWLLVAEGGVAGR